MNPMELPMDGEGHLGESLDLLVDGALAPAQAAAAKAHLDGCTDCTKAHARLCGAVAAARGLGPVRAPEGFAARVLKRVRSQRRAGLRRPGLDQKVPYEGGIIVILVAAAAALMVAYGVHTYGGVFAKNDVPAPRAPATARP